MEDPEADDTPAAEEELSLDIPKRRPGRPCEGEEAMNPRMERYVLNRYINGKLSMSRVARECNLDPSTVAKILDKHDVRKIMKVSRAEIVGTIPKAVVNVQGAINDGDTELSYRLLKDTGALNVDPTSAGSQPGSITVNLGFLNADRAKAVLAAQPASSPDSGYIDVDEEAHEDKG